MSPRDQALDSLVEVAADAYVRALANGGPVGIRDRIRAALLAALSHETNVTCETCGGEGRYFIPGTHGSAEDPCPTCHGSGQVPGPRLILGEDVTRRLQSVMDRLAEKAGMVTLVPKDQGTGGRVYRDIFRDETPGGGTVSPRPRVPEKTEG